MTGWEDEQEELNIEVVDRPPKIIQVTDPHLFKEEKGCLLGLQTRKSLSAVLDDIIEKQLNPDLILATGDISQDQSPESYEYFSDVMDKLETPVCWIPGNHDDVHQMAKSLTGDYFSSAKKINMGKWQIILLDSALPGQVYGRLGREQRNFLSKAIKSQQVTYLFPVLHHHPVDIECQWLDPLGLEDGDELFEILEGCSSIRGLLWGHIHQVYDQYRGKIRMLATPSSSVQFKPLSKEFAADTESPGYRILELTDDGKIETQVNRIEHIEFTVDYSIKGY
ncbi:MAG: 3',5'-cyclic-AMP phosphodiesterase [Gammaproteobacteria bacterium]|nr:MAG: 3',5'-cyclic-AMP phosphodiesterase [Gammaproteobacteria bacterium]